MKRSTITRRAAAGHPTGAPPSAEGLTLVELLVALAVASLIALALSHSLRSTRVSAAAVDEALDPVQLLDLAAELLGEEVSRAAYLGWPVPDVIADLPDGVGAPQFVTPGLVIRAAPAGDSLGVRYVDDTLADGPRARVVSYEAGSDSAGEPQLYRRAAGASRQPIVAGVESLAVVGLVQAGVLLEQGAATTGAVASAVVVRLRAGETSRDVVIELPGRPLVDLGP